MIDHPKLTEALENFAKGVEVNLNGSSVSAAKLAEAIRGASKHEARPIVLTLVNATIRGRLNLNGLGQDDVRITLQLRGCKLPDGMSARSSCWRMLMMHHSHLKFLELPGAELSELVIEESRVDEVLEARNINVTNMLSLSESHFGNGERESVVELREARVGRSLRATNMTCNGKFSGSGARIDGELRLGGSVLGTQPVTSEALDLAGARITGPVELCAADERRFETHGPIKIMNAEIGTLAILGANMNGGGGPSIIADGLIVHSFVKLGPQDDHPLTAVGEMRFILSRISGQFELTSAELTSDEPRCLVLDSSQLGGDIMVGHLHGPVHFKRSFSANSVKCAGKIILTRVFADATGFDEGSAISISQSKVDGPLLIYGAELRGCLNIDHSFFGGLSIHDLESKRSQPLPDLSQFLDGYAHENNALISAIFSTFDADIHCAGIVLYGGDFRMIGAHVKGSLLIANAKVLECRTHALIMQGAQLDGGVMISGTPQAPSAFEGGVVFLGARLGSSFTATRSVIGTSNAKAELSFDSAQVVGDVVVHNTEVFGRLGFSAAKITGNLRLESARISHPGSTALYGRGATVDGQISFSVAFPKIEAKEATRINGNVDLDGVRAGSMLWASLELTENSNLNATDMVIDRSFESQSVIAADNTLIDLSGTRAASLVDCLDSEHDGWGAGKAKLNIDTLRYDRLISPSGRKGHWPSTIRYWRKQWLGRRTDTSSTQAARQLSRVLHEQGLHEASRFVLIDAFTEEAKHAEPIGQKILQSLFGFLFGHGLSGTRAFMTVFNLWLLGTSAIMYLQSASIIEAADQPGVVCSSADPSLYAADVMMPIIDLGQEGKCQISQRPEKRKPLTSISSAGEQFDLLSPSALAEYFLAMYRIFGWIFVSLAIATWSGLFKRSGRGT